MVTTNNKNQINKEIASVKYYYQTKSNGRKYTTKRINLDAKSKFADGENVIVISEADFNIHYDKAISLDDFTADLDSKDAENVEDLQDKYNDLWVKYEDALKQIAMLESEKADIRDKHFEELRDQQTKYEILNIKHTETVSALDKAIAINTANHTAYITALENISLESEKAIKYAISDAVKQTTKHNNAEISKLTWFKRLRKFTLSAPAIEEDSEIFAPAFADVKKAVTFYKFDKLE